MRVIIEQRTLLRAMITNLNERLKLLNESKWGKRYERAYCNSFKVWFLAVLDINFALMMTFASLGLNAAQAVNAEDIGKAFVFGFAAAFCMWIVAKLVLTYWFWRSTVMCLLTLAASGLELVIVFDLIGAFITNYYGLTTDGRIAIVAVLASAFIMPSLAPLFHALFVVVTPGDLQRVTKW